VFFRHVDWEMVIDVYETPNAACFKAKQTHIGLHGPEDGGIVVPTG